MTIDSDRPELYRLASHDVDPRVAARIERRALALLAEERASVELPWIRTGSRLWNGALEPAFATVAVTAYLGWMVHALIPLL
jgi:hypothetical protein